MHLGRRSAAVQVPAQAGGLDVPQAEQGAGRDLRLGVVRFTYEHTGFTGAGGFVMAKLLGRVRTKMLTVGLPAVLDDMN